MTKGAACIRISKSVWETTDQLYTNLLNYAVFSALCNYMKSRIKSIGVNYWRVKSTSVLSELPTGSMKGPDRKFSVEEIFHCASEVKNRRF